MKTMIGALVGAILVFGWQAISHMALHHHDDAYRQVAGQDEAIKAMSAYFKEEGQYVVPRATPGASQQEMERYDAGMRGKPWAMVTFHPVYKNDMGSAIFLSFLTAFVSVWLLLFVMGKNPGNFSTIFLKNIAWGLFAFLFVCFNNNIWLQTPFSVLKGELIDLIVAWSLCGLWLAWWLNNERQKNMVYGKGFGV